MIHILNLIISCLIHIKLTIDNNKSTIIELIIGWIAFKTLAVSSDQFKLSKSQEQRYIDSKKNNIECKLSLNGWKYNPPQQCVPPTRTPSYEIRIINNSDHPVFIRGLTIDKRFIPFNFLTHQYDGAWVSPIRIDSQSEIYYQSRFPDRLRVHEITINFTFGDVNVKLPDWLNKQ
jgi:hypothetical protein